MGKTIQASTPVRLLEPLTSFRFFAALLVFSWHTHIFANYLDKYEFGYVGVSFFFILSGFILTYVYFSRLASGNLRKVKSFYAARIAKLYPVHLLTFLVALTLGLQTLQLQYTTHLLTRVFSTALMNLTLTQSFYPSNIVNFSFNGVAWSISDELFFYALFPVIIYLVARYRHIATPKRLVLAWFIIWASLIGFLATKQSVIDNWVYYIFPPLRLVDFTGGVVLGMCFLKIIENPNNFFDRLQHKYFSVLEVAALSIIVAATLISPYLPQTLRFGMFLIPFWSLVIFVFAWQKGIVSRILSAKSLIFLGNVSFSFYMIHQLIIRTFSSVNIDHRDLVSFAVSLGLASAIYILFEEPYRVRLKTYLEQLTLPSFSFTTAIKRRIPQFSPKPALEEQPVPVLDTTQSTE